MGGGNYVTLFIFLIPLVLIGIFLPLVVSSFVDTSQFNNQSLIYPLQYTYVHGANVTLPNPFCLLPFLNASCSFDLGTFNIFSFQPAVTYNYGLQSINAFSYVPNELAVPLLMVMMISLLYCIIKIFWGS